MSEDTTLVALSSKKYPGLFAVVDAADLIKVSGRRWHVHHSSERAWYAFAWDLTGPKRKRVWMHHVIIGTPPEMREVDHIDGDGLNNRKGNLRVVTHAQNAANRRANCTGKSHYKGVSPAEYGRWMARLRCDGKTILAKRFDTEEDAARAYDDAAYALHGDAAALNFPR